jgi:dipeptidyl-peptidase 4
MIRTSNRAALVLAAAALCAQVPAGAQDRLKSMPGYEQHERMTLEIPAAVKSGALDATWRDDNTVEYSRDGKRYRFDLGSKSPEQIAAPSPLVPEAAGRPLPARGRQIDVTESPDGQHKAFYRDRNVWIVDQAGLAEIQITTDGSDKTRIKNGTASWVYGEELSQPTAMWWSPDSTRLAYYRFDEKNVPDYFLQIDQTRLQSAIAAEAYPKAGVANPIVDLYVYDVSTRKSTRVDVRNGKAFDDAVVGHYVYGVSWSADAHELLFHRTNRRQNILELAAADPRTGETRVVVHEEWPTGWIDNSPAMRFLQDGKRFIWQSSRTGWSNFYLYDLSGKLIVPLTSHTTFEADSIVKVDEAAGLLFYTARDGDNFLKMQLHRVGLDGGHDVRLTDPAFHHIVGACGTTGSVRRARRGAAANSCGISPDSRYFIDVYQTHDVPPATRVADAATGRTVAELAHSDLTRFDELGFRTSEMFTYQAADGRTTLHGLLEFPSHFNPASRYPVLVSVYGGPGSAGNTARETFTGPNPTAEYGFLMLTLDSRAVPGLGKRTLDEIYLKLGQAEVDDMAAGVKSLWNRPYFDKTRVGIYGTSYGGYASVMSLLRHPEAFAAASASSPVTAWYHYDTIYTERYMGLPQENREGYEAGSAMTYAANLKGRLMLYYGTADDNVHPSNVMQLIVALQNAGKSFDVQVGPDRGHSSINTERMMEFFIENLVMHPPAASAVE